MSEEIQPEEPQPAATEPEAASEPEAEQPPAPGQPEAAAQPEAAQPEAAEQKPESPQKAPPKKAKKGKRERRQVPHAVAYIKSSFNNTIVTIADLKGNVIASSSAGQVNFKGSRKSTPSAAQMAAEDAGRKAIDQFGVVKLDIQVKGPGSGRETAVRSLQNLGIEIAGILDTTPMPYNGCRQPKRRRV